MKSLIIIIPFFLSSCFYIKQGVGLTTYQYDKCKEYYDANGVYHKDCPKSLIQKSSEEVVKVSKCIAKKSKDFFESFGKKRNCPCKEKNAK